MRSPCDPSVLAERVRKAHLRGLCTVTRRTERERGLQRFTSSSAYKYKTVCTISHADQFSFHILQGERVEDRIRTMDVSSNVSPIATLGFVREAMVAQQREMGKAKGVILDGRDIGTVVFPDAELKIFVTASAEIRAQRRYDELTAKGEQCNYEDILKNVKERDYIDSHREISPLTQAEDAIVLDNSNMTINEQQEWLLKLTKEAVSASE